MAINAPQITYRAEIINGFDKTVSVLRDTVTVDYLERGGSAVFLVADSINQVAHSRGLNGDIPADPLALTQTTATLVPWHKLVRVNDFNMFSAQSNLIDPMKSACMAAINRKIDDDIITTLNTGTTTITAGGPMTVAKAMTARGILGANKVADDGNLTFLISPAALTYLMQTTEFANSQYVAMRPYETGKPNYGDMRMVYKWAGLTVIVDPTLPGAGTSAEKCFMYHKASIGHALNKNALEFDMDYDREQKYSWSNCSAFIGTALLQNTGIVVITHDGSAVVSG